MNSIDLNDQVRSYWERQPCGTDDFVVGELPKLSKEWFEEVERYRYTVEPFIHSVAQFTRHCGSKVLEVGVGAGTDHLQWARAGAICHGVDLTDAAIETTRQRLALWGFHSELKRVDAEQGLPFPDGQFDVVYSWGVIHHSEHPERIIEEIRRVLKPGGQFIGMMYGLHSPTVLKLWVKHALLKGKPWRSFRDVVWNHMESIGTKAYTCSELQVMFARYSGIETQPIMTSYDKSRFSWLIRLFPESWGWFVALHAVR